MYASASASAKSESIKTIKKQNPTTDDAARTRENDPNNNNIVVQKPPVPNIKSILKKSNRNQQNGNNKKGNFFNKDVNKTTHVDANNRSSRFVSSHGTDSNDRRDLTKYKNMYNPNANKFDLEYTSGSSSSSSLSSNDSDFDDVDEMAGGYKSSEEFMKNLDLDSNHPYQTRRNRSYSTGKVQTEQFRLRKSDQRSITPTKNQTDVVDESLRNSPYLITESKLINHNQQAYNENEIFVFQLFSFFGI